MDDAKIVTGEIIEQDSDKDTVISAIQTSGTEQTSSNGASVILNLEQLIKSHITRIDALKIEARKHKEMLDDIFTNDETYKTHEKSAKEAARVKTMTKSQIMKRPNVATIVEKVKNTKQEAKDLEAAMSDYLREYERLSGSNEVQGEDGEIREIVYTAKLIKKSSYPKK